MASSDRGTGWTPILREAAENVRGRVRTALLRRPALDTAELKRLLDIEAHQAVEETLRNIGASAHLISEEGQSTIGDGGAYVIADPVDGTTNLARGVPLAVTSLAVSETPRLSGAVAGLVMDLYTGDVFRAERNRGAWRAGKPIHTGEPRPLGDAIVSVDISKGAPLDEVERLISGAEHIRQLGCAAFSLCLVASGVFDAHVDLRGMLRATDAVAGLLILREAGGIYSVNGSIGGDLELMRRSRLSLLAASGPGMLDTILGLVEQPGRA